MLAQRTTLGQSNSAIHELHHDIHDVVQSLQARFPFLHAVVHCPVLKEHTSPSQALLTYRNNILMPLIFKTSACKDTTFILAKLRQVGLLTDS